MGSAALGPPDAQVEAMRGDLLRWYHTHQRDLPWRHTDDPYAILVSEVMLQQTQAQRVVAHYHRFLAQFPSFATLASAPPGAVIRAWAPLGYNLRAVRLHRLAKVVMDAHHGVLPQEVTILEALPGLGEYTAAAVACFAFGTPLPVLDTNVRRVLRRAFFGAEDAPKLLIRQVAGRALPQDVASEWNQALMDLGATVCLARRPACSRCPWQASCRAAPFFRGRGEAPKVAEARPPYRAKQPPFAGSSRYYRGRIVDHLRTLAPGEAVRLTELGLHLRQDFSPHAASWLARLVEGLERDSLVQVHRESDSGDPLHWRVSLP
ncbi:MAG: A/G-specific adenine glycosylase [Chloroflexi bacterium]|nr:A/G-specific adenine glycosylase [Chloroflexota bacterium]